MAAVAELGVARPATPARELESARPLSILAERERFLFSPLAQAATAVLEGSSVLSPEATLTAEATRQGLGQVIAYELFRDFLIRRDYLPRLTTDQRRDPRCITLAFAYANDQMEVFGQEKTREQSASAWN